MKRWSDEHAKAVAKEFSRSDMAKAWRWFGEEIRDAVLDSVIMQQMRIADSVDPVITFTANEVIAFRQLVQAKLAAGVPRSGDVPARFEVES